MQNKLANNVVATLTVVILCVMITFGDSAEKIRRDNTGRYAVIGGVSDMVFLIYAVVLLVYFFCPKYIKVVMLIINLLVPDVVPVVDELLMVVGLFTPSLTD